MSVIESDVLEIMDSSLTESEIYPFLNTAQLLVNASLSSSGLDSSILDEIVKYLTAHLACVKSPFAIRKKIDVAEETYGYTGGKGLDATPYGEMVKMLDSTGILLSNMSNQMVTIGVINYHPLENQ